MICAPEAQKDIYDSATGVKTVSVSKPTWVDHVYSCDYIYPGGARIRLAVKEMSSTAETTAYYDSLATKLHKTDAQVSVPGAFQVKDGSVVVRRVMESKDNQGFNALTGEYVDVVKAGIITPTKVERTALQNAAEVAILLLTTDCIVVEAPKKDEGGDGHGHDHDHGGGMGDMGGMM